MLELLVALVLLRLLVLTLARLGRRRPRRVGRACSATLPTLRVDVARTFERKKRAALDAASGVLR